MTPVLRPVASFLAAALVLGCRQDTRQESAFRQRAAAAPATMTTAPPPDTAGWTPDSVLRGPFQVGEIPPSDRIRFRNGREIDTGRWDTEVLAVFSTRRGIPYLVLLGSGCTECDAMGRDVYMKTPLDLPIPHSGRIAGLFPAAGIYRGVWGEREDWPDSIASDSRAFLGACLSPHGEDYVVFERYRSRTGWRTATGTGSVVGDTVLEAHLDNSWAPLDSVVARTATGACKELPRLEQISPR
jgi:hypothetical protein